MEQRALMTCNGARACTLLSLCRLARGIIFLLAGALPAAGASSLSDFWEKSCLACADIYAHNYTIYSAESTEFCRTILQTQPPATGWGHSNAASPPEQYQPDTEQVRPIGAPAYGPQRQISVLPNASPCGGEAQELLCSSAEQLLRPIVPRPAGWTCHTQ